MTHNGVSTTCPRYTYLFVACSNFTEVYVMCSTLISHCDGYIIANKPICPETCVFTISQDNHDYYSSNTYRDLSGAHYYVEPSEIDESLIDPILSDGRFLAAVIACYKSTRPLMMICSFVLGLDSSAPHEQNAFT